MLIKPWNRPLWESARYLAPGKEHIGDFLRV